MGGWGVAGEPLINNLLSERLCLPPSVRKRTDQQPIHVANEHAVLLIYFNHFNNKTSLDKITKHE